jgi:hypothetical protein
MMPEDLQHHIARRRHEWQSRTAFAHLRRVFDLLPPGLFVVGEDREIDPTPDGWRQFEPTGRVVIVASGAAAKAALNALAELRQSTVVPEPSDE